MSEGDDRKALVGSILDAYRSGKLEVPGLPEVAFRIRKLVDEPGVNANKIAKAVQVDPALMARLVKVSNSPMFCSNRKVEDCRSAIARMGLTTTRNLVTSFSMRQVFNADSPVTRDVLREIWQQSSYVGAIAYILGKVTPGLLPDRALLAGLVFQIGALPVLRYAEKYPSLRSDRKALWEMIRLLAPKLGKLVLVSWSFDEELSEIPAQLESWDYAPGEALSYVDLVIVARAHSLIGKAGNEDVPPLPEIGSFRKFPISKLGPDASLEVLEQAQEEIDSLTTMLTSG
jgi:HD-like signal output (HDOD) protein